MLENTLDDRLSRSVIAHGFTTAHVVDGAFYISRPFLSTREYETHGDEVSRCHVLILTEIANSFFRLPSSQFSASIHVSKDCSVTQSGPTLTLRVQFVA